MSKELKPLEDIADIHNFIAMFHKYIPDLERIDTTLRFALNAAPCIKSLDEKAFCESSNVMYVSAATLFRMLERMAREEIAHRALPVPEKQAVTTNKSVFSGAVRYCDICDISECHTHALKKQAVSVEDVARQIADALPDTWRHEAFVDLCNIAAKAAMRACGIKVEG